MARKKPAPEPAQPGPSLRLEWRSPTELLESPLNWRTHPEAQLTALRDAIDEVGWAGVVLVNEGTGRMIDGHARKRIARPDEKVPVLVGNWTEAQERLILATLDPLSAQATADAGRLDALLRDVQTGSGPLAELLAGLAQEHGLVSVPMPSADVHGRPEDQETPAAYSVLVACKDEAEQQALLERLTGEGFDCRSLIS
jgi:hypothetical protein